MPASREEMVKTARNSLALFWSGITGTMRGVTHAIYKARFFTSRVDASDAKLSSNMFLHSDATARCAPRKAPGLLWFVATGVVVVLIVHGVVCLLRT